MDGRERFDLPAFASHCSGRTVKGIKRLSALYPCDGRSIPAAFGLVQKPLQCDGVEAGRLEEKAFRAPWHGTDRARESMPPEAKSTPPSAPTRRCGPGVLASFAAAFFVQHGKFLTGTLRGSGSLRPRGTLPRPGSRHHGWR